MTGQTVGDGKGSSISDDDLIEEKIVAFIKLNRTDKGVPTLAIAKAVIGPEAVKKSVNRNLYNLQKKGIVRRIGNTSGADPRWDI
jgi:hypothetical protein